MERGRLLGVDYGTVRVGLAITDPDRIIASPLETLTRRSAAEDAASLKAVVEREQVMKIILGLPVHTNGREGQKAGEARQYAAWLIETLGLPLQLWDERFTTVIAESALWNAGLTNKQRKLRRDRVAAQVLLQSFLEAGCPDDEGTTPG